MLIAFDPAGVELARERGCLIIEFDPPTSDPFEAQELAETAYHLLWELVHVFFEHRVARRRTTPARPASSTRSWARPRPTWTRCWPTCRESVRDEGGRDRRAARADAGRGPRRCWPPPRPSCARGWTAAGGCCASATAARPPTPWTPWPTCASRRTAGRPERALDLTEDTGDHHRGRQRHRHRGHLRPPGDRPRARRATCCWRSPRSGNSANVIDALAEARRRGLATIAMVGYDGGRVADEELADHVVVTRSEHIPRIQEAQASAWHVLRRADRGRRKGVAPMTRRVRARVEGVVQGVGFRPFVYRLAGELGLRRLGAQRRARGAGGGRGARAPSWSDFLARLPAEAPPLAVVERVCPRRLRPTGADGFEIREQRRAASRWRSSSPDVGHLRRLPGRAVRPRRPPPPLPVPQLHRLRAAVHDRARRARTTGRSPRWPAFAMCAACQAEYDDPADRRFHAQPNACPECGPRLSIARSPDVGGGAGRRAGRGGEGAGRLPPGLPRRTTEAAARAARAQAPRGQAVRADGRATSTPPGRSWSSTPPRRRCCSAASGRS